MWTCACQPIQLLANASGVQSTYLHSSNIKCTTVICSIFAGLGKAVKDRMRKKFQAHFDEHTDDWVDGIITASQRRVLYATWLSEAWKEFFAKGGQEMVRMSQVCMSTVDVHGGHDTTVVYLF